LRSDLRALVVVPDSDWEHHARCRSEGAGLFFGPNRFEPKLERTARETAAKAVCADCPVIEPCRQHALAEAEPYGVWGGMGEVERRAMLEQRSSEVTATAV